MMQSRSQVDSLFLNLPGCEPYMLTTSDKHAQKEF